MTSAACPPSPPSSSSSDVKPSRNDRSSIAEKSGGNGGCCSATLSSSAEKAGGGGAVALDVSPPMLVVVEVGAGQDEGDRLCPPCHHSSRHATNMVNKGNEATYFPISLLPLLLLPLPGTTNNSGQFLHRRHY